MVVATQVAACNTSPMTTTTTSRTDVHSPKALITEDYDYMGSADNEAPALPGAASNRLWLTQLVLNSVDNGTLHRGTHQCHHCGAHLRYFAVLQHLPTGTYIAVGETCLENRFEQASADFHAMRKAAQLDRQAQRIKTAANEALATIVRHDVRDALAKGFDLFLLDLSNWGYNVVSDIRARLWRYGTVSPKQVDLIARLIDEVPAKKAQQAEKDSEVKTTAPTGRVTFTGIVVSQKWKDSDWGGCLKITVKVTTDQGVWLVWLSKPSSIDCEVGDTVTMTANLSASDKPEFAFGKRPTKASVVKAVTV